MGSEVMDLIGNSASGNGKSNKETGESMIKEFEKTEINEVMKIWLDTTIDAHNFIPENYWITNYHVVKNQYIPVAKTFVYQDNNLVHGFISIIEGFFIGALFVQKDCQRQGIGLQLINHCKAIYPKLELAVYIENVSAITFYKRCGFVITAEQENEDSGFKECIMSWEK